MSGTLRDELAQKLFEAHMYWRPKSGAATDDIKATWQQYISLVGPDNVFYAQADAALILTRAGDYACIHCGEDIRPLNGGLCGGCEDKHYLIEVFRHALKKIASLTQTDKLLWWQKLARVALASERRDSPEPGSCDSEADAEPAGASSHGEDHA